MIFLQNLFFAVNINFHYHTGAYLDYLLLMDPLPLYAHPLWTSYVYLSPDTF